MRVTLKDIAEKVGVAPSTVSKALNNRPGVSGDLRTRIVAAARTMGVEIPESADGDQEKKHMEIFLSNRHSIESDPFYSIIARGAVSELQNKNICSLHVVEDEANGMPTPCLPAENNVAGMVLIGANFSDRFLSSVRAKNVPAVLVDDIHPAMNYVAVDNSSGIEQAIGHLTQLGHSRVIYLTGPLDHRVITERFNLFANTFTAHPKGEAFQLVEADGWSIQDGEKAMGDLGDTTEYTAVFAANDRLAIGAIQSLGDRGYSVPEDMSVIGFDDIEWASHCRPALTTIEVPKMKMGVVAAKLLLMTEPGNKYPVHIRIATRLLVRDSTAIARF